VNKSSPSPLSGIFHSIIIPIPTSLTLTLEWRNFIVNIFEANFCLTGGGGTLHFFWSVWSMKCWYFVGHLPDYTGLGTFRITQGWLLSGLHRDGYLPDYTRLATFWITQGWYLPDYTGLATFRNTQSWLPSELHRVGYLPDYTGYAGTRTPISRRFLKHKLRSISTLIISSLVLTCCTAGHSTMQLFSWTASTMEIKSIKFIEMLVLRFGA